MTVRICHQEVFGVCAETYWRELCLSLSYQERLFREVLGFTSVQLLEHSGDYERGVKRRLRLIKPLQAPAPVIRVLGSSVTFDELSEFDPAAQRWSYRMVLSHSRERLDIHGAVQLAERAGGVTQLSDNSLTCRLFGVGALVEPFMARSTEHGHAERSAFARRYIAEKRLR